MIVIAAYNEAAIVGDVIRSLLGHYSHIVLVDDGSHDDTAAIAQAAGATVLRHARNLGQGAALQTAISYALSHGADYIVTFDADGQHSPQDIATMFTCLKQRNVQIVLGSRFLGAAPGIGLVRKCLLKQAAWYTGLMTGYRFTDAHNGLRLMTRFAAERLHIRCHGMAHASEIVFQLARQRLALAECPVTIRYTDYSTSKGQRNRHAWRIIVDLMKARFDKRSDEVDYIRLQALASPLPPA